MNLGIEKQKSKKSVPSGYTINGKKYINFFNGHGWSSWVI